MLCVGRGQRPSQGGNPGPLASSPRITLAEPAFLQQRFRKDPDFVYRRIAQECLVVPIRHQVGDLNYIYVLNPVADRIWELLDGQNTVQEIRDRLLAEFKAP